jgi:hypothetical protein
MFNPNGGLGAGAYFQDSLATGTWIQIVAVFDPGDGLDDSAGATIYRDSIVRQEPSSPGAKYSNIDYLTRRPTETPCCASEEPT